MSDRLLEICDYKREEVRQRRQALSLTQLEEQISRQSLPRGFQRRLIAQQTTGKAALITEIKKASPSAGLIREDFAPAALAVDYAKGGASCLSVLTDERFFQGCNTFFQEARNATSLPVLRKDFMVDLWQISESRALGADCILLILAAIDDAQALDMAQAAQHYGMDILIETHDAVEIERALRLPAGMIGINNRNLKTMQTDCQTTVSLSPLIPPDRLLVSESGIKTAADIKWLARHNVRAFLIGEHLMRQPDLIRATQDLCDAFSSAANIP